MNSFYLFDAPFFAELLTPIALHNPLYFAFLDAMQLCTDKIYRQFFNYVNGLDTGDHGQVCQLEKLLNDRFDNFQRRIFIRIPVANFDGNLIWDESFPNNQAIIQQDGDTPVFFLEAQGQIGTSGVDFEVVLPAGMNLTAGQSATMKRLLNANKIASKRCNIIIDN